MARWTEKAWDAPGVSDAGECRGRLAGGGGLDPARAAHRGHLDGERRGAARRGWRRRGLVDATANDGLRCGLRRGGRWPPVVPGARGVGPWVMPRILEPSRLVVVHQEPRHPGQHRQPPPRPRRSGGRGACATAGTAPGGRRQAGRPGRRRCPPATWWAPAPWVVPAWRPAGGLGGEGATPAGTRAVVRRATVVRRGALVAREAAATGTTPVSPRGRGAGGGRRGRRGCRACACRGLAGRRPDGHDGGGVAEGCRPVVHRGEHEPVPGQAEVVRVAAEGADDGRPGRGCAPRSRSRSPGAARAGSPVRALTSSSRRPWRVRARRSERAELRVRRPASPASRPGGCRRPDAGSPDPSSSDPRQRTPPFPQATEPRARPARATPLAPCRLPDLRRAGPARRGVPGRPHHRAVALHRAGAAGGGGRRVEPGRAAARTP